MAPGFKQLIPTTVIMPIRLDCPERLANAMTTTKYLLDVLHVRQVLMVETDTNPKLLGSIVHPRLRWLYVQTESTHVGFQKSQAINTALPWIETASCVIWDCDALLRPEAVMYSVTTISGGALDLLVPFTRMVMLKRESSYGTDVLAEKWPLNPDEQAEGECADVPGLIVFLSTSYFRHIRGMSEVFRTYGDEDIELARRIAQLGGRTARLVGDALHLWHPTLRRAAPEAQLEESAKQRLLEQLNQSTASEMRTYLGVTERVGDFTKKRQLREPSASVTVPVLPHFTVLNIPDTIRAPAPITRYKVRTMEYQIVDHCNLSCAKCSHLSPYVKEGFISPAQLESDLVLASKNIDADLLWLLGGEPTLHPELHTLIKIAKKYYRVGLITNGILLPTLTDELIKDIDHIKVSVYPEVFKTDTKLRAFAARARDLGVGRFECVASNYFFDVWPTTIQTDEEAYRSCVTCLPANVWKCYSIYKGFFYKCPSPLLADIHAKKLNFTEFNPAGDGIPLNDPAFLAKLPNYLRKETVLSTCKICIGAAGKNEPHRQLTSAELREYDN